MYIMRKINRTSARNNLFQLVTVATENHDPIHIIGKKARLCWYLSGTDLKANAEELLEMLKTNPFKTPRNFEKLRGDLEEAFSRRINIQLISLY